MTVTSKFDPSVSAEYILGLVPRERELGGGFNSRGFYVSLEEFAEEYGDDLASLALGLEIEGESCPDLEVAEDRPDYKEKD